MAGEFCSTAVRAMNIEKDLDDLVNVWNEIVREGNAFTQTDELPASVAESFFKAQVSVGVAEVVCDDMVCGFYILHPRNVGRCVQVANLTIGVASNMRGRRVGELLVRDALVTAGMVGFKSILVDNVTESNEGARHLLNKVGFEELGRVAGGFRRNDDTFEDVFVYAYDLTK